jgi:hypothetical protein
MDRIQPIPPRPPAVQPIPALRRTDRAEEKREHDQEEQRRRKKRQPAPEQPPPDDGMPHIDVRV